MQRIAPFSSRSPFSTFVACALAGLAACSAPPPATKAPEYALTHQERVPLERQNRAYRCLDIMLEAAAREVDRIGARPTILSRQMMIQAVAVFDAWAAYDEHAVGSRFGGRLRRPAAERTLANKEIAVAYASHRALLGVFPDDAAWLNEQMRALGHDPDDVSTDVTTPQGIGNVVAAAVLEYRLRDGANLRCGGLPCRRLRRRKRPRSARDHRPASGYIDADKSSWRPSARQAVGVWPDQRRKARVKALASE